jgi:hypothetical protein
MYSVNSLLGLTLFPTFLVEIISIAGNYRLNVFWDSLDPILNLFLWHLLPAFDPCLFQLLI